MNFPSELFADYGNPIKISFNGSAKVCRGFIEPLRQRYNGRYTPDMRIDLGVFNKNHYLLIAPPDTRISKSFDTFVESGDKKYFVRNSDTFKVNGKALYVWAVLSACTEPQGDDYDD